MDWPRPTLGRSDENSKHIKVTEVYDHNKLTDRLCERR